MYTRSELIVLPIAFVVMIAVAALLRLFLKDKAEKIRAIPFIVVIVLLGIGEIVKQIFEFRSADGYGVWSLPLHFCSTYLIWFSLAEFTKGSFRARMRSVAFVSTLYLTVGLYIQPRSVIGSACDNLFASFGTAHTFFFHHLIVFYAMLCLAFRRFQPDKKDALAYGVCMATYFVIACLFGHALGANYFNVLHSDVPFFEAFRQRAGQVAYTLVLGGVTISAGPLFIALCVGVRAFLEKKKREKPSQIIT